jgi:hypothetical protein
MESESNLKLLQCIDAGLDSIGSAGRQTVYWYLAQKCDLKREGVPDNPNEFMKALKNLFGQGAGILERTIVRHLRQAFNVTLGESLGDVLTLIKRKNLSALAGNHMRNGSIETNLDE